MSPVEPHKLLQTHAIQKHLVIYRAGLKNRELQKAKIGVALAKTL